MRLSQNHPERLDGEIYIGNSYGAQSPGWLTTRIGSVAIDRAGRIMPDSQMRPAFVHRAEVERRLAEYQAEPDQRAYEVGIAALQEMLEWD